MGLREKVALISIALIQIIFVHCSPGDKTPIKSSDSNKLKQNNVGGTVTQPSIVITIKPQLRVAKTKSNEGEKYEELRKTFNFPDIEYPTAPTPRPPFYLQETNILQRSPVQRASDYLSSTANPFSADDNKKSLFKSKYKDKPIHIKTTKKPGITLTFSEFGTTPKPYCFREAGAFPDVEYPLSAKDIWKPNYWKPIPTTGANNEINKNEIIPKATGKSNVLQIFVTSSRSPVSKSEPHRTKSKDEQQQTPLPSLVNDNQEKMITKEITSPLTTPTPISSELNQNVTPAPIESCTQSTTSFVLTPYKTVYFDTPPSYIDTKVLEDNNLCTPTVPKKTTGKKKTKKKSKKSRSKTTSIEQDEKCCTSSPLIGHNYETQIDSYALKDSPLSYNASIPLPEEGCLTTNMPVSIFTVMPEEPISKVNLTKSETCSSKSKDTVLSKYIGTTTPSYLCSEIEPTQTSVTTHNNDKGPTISNDDKVVPISAINTIDSHSTEHKVGSCFIDNVISSNKSSTCVNKINDFLLSCREDVNIPSVDEEFTTDVYPDFGENTLPIFTTSTSTLSPPILNEVDEEWVNSEVIDPYRSLTYPDELEQYYIMVP